MTIRFATSWLPLALAAASLPVFGQIDISGQWSGRIHHDQNERGLGPDLGDFTALPINDSARLRAQSYKASILTLPEWQCRPHPADYMAGRAGFNIRLTAELDPQTQEIKAWHHRVAWMGQERVIWMDGRAHPGPEAPHTWQGFSTGKWEGNMLTVTTTHLKMGFLRRNGVPRSPEAKLTEHFMRHGNFMTVASIVEDPVYLTEPLPRSVSYVLDVNQMMAPYPCETVVEVPRPEGEVPHFLPGANPFLAEWTTSHNLPAEASRGGAEQLYPEYKKKFKTAPARTSR
ncbi:MAG: hypothetical protein ABL967_00280 [Bryobacteraceae bacterium]